MKNDEILSPTLAYSPRQLCRAAGISISLLYQMWREGDEPKYRYCGSRRLILLKDANEWMKYLPTEQPRTEALGTY